MTALSRPNFFIVGAAKCGTSSIANYIGQHPDIFISPIKEPYYFVSQSHFDQEADYLELFEGVKNEKLIGEASTGYLYDELSPKLIKGFCPAAKIIVLLRNPIDMAFSLWKYMTAHGGERLSFEDALNEESNRKENRSMSSFSGRRENYYYVERARYFSQVKRYVDTFGADSVKILLFEEFINSPIATCQDVFDFLETSNRFEPTISVINAGGAARFRWLRYLKNRRYPFLRRVIPIKARHVARVFVRDINVVRSEGVRMTDEIRDLLHSKFRDDVALLQDLTGNKFQVWQDFSQGSSE